MRAGRGIMVLVVASVLAGCGDDSTDDTEGPGVAVQTDAPSTTVPTTSSTAPSTSAPPTTAPMTAATTAPRPTLLSPPPGASEAELAAWAVLTPDVMPAGWLYGPPSDDEEDDAKMVQQIAECGGLDPTLIGDTVLGDAKAESDEFDDP